MQKPPWEVPSLQALSICLRLLLISQLGISYASSQAQPPAYHLHEALPVAQAALPQNTAEVHPAVPTLCQWLQGNLSLARWRAFCNYTLVTSVPLAG